MYKSNHKCPSICERILSTSEFSNFNGEVSITKPRDEIRSLILFFRPPYPYYSSPRGQTSQDRFLDEQVDFRKRLQALVKTDSISSPFFQEGEIESMRSNIFTALRFIEKGYSHKDKRRTGEPYDMHSIRVFLRGVPSLHMATSKKEAQSISTALLARIFHDEAENDDKEKNKNFTLTPPSPNDAKNICHVYTKDLKGSYDLSLAQKNRDLLLLEIEALTMPPNPEGKVRNGEATEEQIIHLLDKAEIIADQYSPLDAYLTLRAKIDDRIDNLITYFEGHDKNKDNTKVGLQKKIGETIKYFKIVEEASHKYLDCYIQEDPDKHSILAAELVKNEVSVVDVCNSLLVAKGFNKLFQKQIEIMQGGYDSSKLGIFAQFLIPNHNPQAPYSAD
jgi:hypothetical protein